MLTIVTKLEIPHQMMHENIINVGMSGAEHWSPTALISMKLSKLMRSDVSLSGSRGDTRGDRRGHQKNISRGSSSSDLVSDTLGIVFRLDRLQGAHGAEITQIRGIE